MTRKMNLAVTVSVCVLTGCLTTGFAAGSEVSYDQMSIEQVAALAAGTEIETPSPAPVEQILAQASESESPTPAVVEPPITGIMAEGETLTEQLAWLTRTADSHNTYILEATADENIAPYEFRYDGAINVTVVLRGDSENRTIRLQSHGKMFTVKGNVTFILDNNITLMGHNGNNATMVHLDGGTFRMRTGSAIIGNGIGVTNWTGGAVGINSGDFEMSGGTISGNTVAQNGGGVGLYGGTFTMTGGTISGNSARNSGGGVFVGGGTFTMRGGEITGNTAREYGGGVYKERYSGIFTKTGGTITGYNSDQDNGNVVRDADGNMLARRGHAAFISVDQRKETTAGPRVNLDQNKPDGWNN